ncbi:MAG TPA: helicase-related protein [Thermoanaerobaculia bacterium]|nr:helicase-related protein [Thermoanaerobaculia bacterium]
MEPREEIRESLIRFLKRELYGPADDEPEVLTDPPTSRYIAGVLFPAQQITDPDDGRVGEEEDAEESTSASAPDAPEADDEWTTAEDALTKPPHGGDEVSSDEPSSDEPILLANAYQPSAVGLTCMLAPGENDLIVTPYAAVYRSRKAPAKPNGYEPTEWVREPLALEAQRLKLNDARLHSQTFRLAPGRLSLQVVARKLSDGARLVTVSLYNETPGQRDRPVFAKDCFYQVGFEVTGLPDSLPFCELPPAHRPLDDLEAESLALLYRNRRTFARGHGCAADWGVDHDGRTDRIVTSIIPASKVLPLEPMPGSEAWLSMEVLSREADGGAESTIPGLLRNLTIDYEQWIDRRQVEVQKLGESFRATARRHLDLCRKALDRMERGVELLERQPLARQAFMLANRAMLMQQYHYQRSRRLLDEPWEELPESYRSRRDGHHVTGYWRSFQLAFILMNLTAFAEEGTETREIVDLIWFPTGGGKTEAYLGLASYVMFLRRLERPSNAGCAVLMRYTLRLLTAQQFQRASALLCACESLRAESPAELGGTPFSIGLWVGSKLTPNRRSNAVEILNKLANGDGRAENPFQLLTCPWCGTALDEEGRLGYRRVSLRPGDRTHTVKLICPERRCGFATRERPLPVLVIDEDIYESPPTLLIGTVDKFAMLAWYREAGALFGNSDPDGNGPPELIIQDELHLISGPLGSIVGHFEATIEALCSRGGRRPKIVASTATIRRAGEQCRALYNREAFQFPPPGLDASNSYFASEDHSAAGRIYVGVFPAAASSPVTAHVRVTAALLQGIRLVSLPESLDESARDPYWTLVQYFGSLRELGRASSLMEDEVPEYLDAMGRRLGLKGAERRWLGRPFELTSRRGPSEIPEILEHLEISYPAADHGRRPLDTLLATNMISVGVDIGRLGLMLVVGQPKTTSEYIQASSRVGRTVRAPGLVVTLYNTGKPRDRSHYEHHRSYHDSFYRHVEPTSVTPYSLPVLERALPAQLVIAGRHLAHFESPEELDLEDPALLQFQHELVRRVEVIDEEHTQALARRLQALLKDWNDTRPREWGHLIEPPESQPLMYPAGSEPREEWDGAWSVPISMRNVDTECQARVLPRYPGEEE